MAPSLLRVATLGLKLISGTYLGPFEAPVSGFLMKGSLDPKPYGKRGQWSPSIFETERGDEYFPEP